MAKKRSLKRLYCLALFCMMSASTIWAAGYPGEYLLTSRWRDLFAPYSPITNPALLTEENYQSIRGAFSSISVGGNGFNFWETGYTLPIGLDQSLGLSWFAEADGEVFQSKSNDLTGQITDTSTSGGRNTNSFFMASYAYNFWRGLSVGANANIAYQSNFSDGPSGSKALTGFGLDVGFTYRTLLDPVFGTHILGLDFQNIIAPTIGSSEYPRNVRLSWHSNYWEHQIESGLDINLKDLLAKTNEFTTTDAAGNLKELAKTTQLDMNYRLGFYILRFINVYGLAGFARIDSTNYGFNYWGLAAGINVPQVNNGRDFSVNYQYLSLTKNQDQDQIASPYSHTFYLRVQLGQHREEIYAARMARSVDLAPSELYNKACKLYFAGKYWDAYFVFSQIIVQYPGFFKNDWVQYYKSSCLENLDMREMAAAGYTKAKQEYPRSATIPYVNLGQMRIFYRDDNSNSVYSQYTILNKPEVSDSLKFHAYYLMAETYLKQKNYQPAIELFAQIPETHPDYIFAQHSLGVSQILSLKMEDALNALGNCIEAKAQTEGQKEIVNRSYVLLGYVFYEQMALSKAVTAMRMVPKSSYYYEDALLGLCWTALRARQWNDCISMSQSLQKFTQKIPLQSDASLIEGYAHLMLKDYKQAFDVLQSAQNKLQAFKPLPSDSLEAQKNTYHTNRKDYASLSGSVETISKELQSSFVLQQIDSLHKSQENGKKLIDNFYQFTNEFNRQKFFSRNTDAIKSDIDYTLAISQKLSQQSSKSQVQEQMQNKQKDIDEQIDKLKKEMNKIDSDKK